MKDSSQFIHNVCFRLVQTSTCQSKHHYVIVNLPSHNTETDIIFFRRVACSVNDNYNTSSQYDIRMDIFNGERVNHVLPQPLLNITETYVVTRIVQQTDGNSDA